MEYILIVLLLYFYKGIIVKDLSTSSVQVMGKLRRTSLHSRHVDYKRSSFLYWKIIFFSQMYLNRPIMSLDASAFDPPWWYKVVSESFTPAWTKQQLSTMTFWEIKFCDLNRYRMEAKVQSGFNDTLSRHTLNLFQRWLLWIDLISSSLCCPDRAQTGCVILVSEQNECYEASDVAAAAGGDRHQRSTGPRKLWRSEHNAAKKRPGQGESVAGQFGAWDRLVHPSWGDGPFHNQINVHFCTELCFYLPKSTRRYYRHVNKLFVGRHRRQTCPEW